MTVLESPLDAISREARPYPAHLLAGCETGLVLFAAAFLGHNDAIHFARNDVLTTCVDVDGDRLAEMGAVYARGWSFLVDDAWRFALKAHSQGRQWDAVSVDTFSGDATDRSLASLELWCSIASRLVTATMPAGMDPGGPAGWDATFFPRSSAFSWLVLTRD